MLKTHWKLISHLERVGDNLVIAAAFFVAYYLRDELLVAIELLGLPTPEAFRLLGPIEDYLLVLGIALPLYNALVSVLGGYRSMRLVSFVRLCHLTATPSVIVFLAIGSVLFLLKLDLSRSFVGFFCFFCGFSLFIERLVIVNALRYFRVRGKNFRNILVVGTGRQAREIFFELLKQPEIGLKVVGFVDLEGKLKSNLKPGSENSGSIDERYLSCVYDLPARVVADYDGFEAALKKHAVDEVLFTDSLRYYSLIEVLAHIAVDEGVGVTLAADVFSLGIINSDISYFGSVPLIQFQPSPGTSLRLVIKRLFDIVVSMICLAIFSPFMLLIAVMIKLESKGTVFFRQRRVGLNGRTFMLLKFRSMVVDAEKKLNVLKEKNEMNGPVFKIKNDPRVTRFGRFIRRHSIDELPQLINVLRGDMSLVGPRPPLPSEVTRYMRKQRRRVSMRPGMTCTWQVSGRNDIPDFEQWAKLDLEYIDHWSLGRDVKLLIKTIPAVLSGAGAR